MTSVYTLNESDLYLLGEILDFCEGREWPQGGTIRSLGLIMEGVRRAIEGCQLCGSLRATTPRDEWVQGSVARICEYCEGVLDRSADVHYREKWAPPPRLVPEPTTGTVYFARLPNRYIKIGVTRRLRERMRSLDAQLLATLDGGLAKEEEMHRRFSGLRVDAKREWFHAGRDLLEFIESLPTFVMPRDDITDVELLPIKGPRA